MSFSLNLVESLKESKFASQYPEVLAYLNEWIMDETNKVCGVEVRTKPIVNKTETEQLIVFYLGNHIGWLLGKEAKREEWEKQYPGELEKVWVIPESHSVLKPLTDAKGIFDYMRVYLKLNPPAPRVVPATPSAFTVTSENNAIIDFPPEGVTIGCCAIDEPPAEEPRPDDAEALMAAAQAELLAKEEGAPPPPKPTKRKAKLHNIQKKDVVKKEKKPKVPKIKPDKTLRTVFREHLSKLNIEALKKPWMATKALRLIETPEELQAWVDEVLADKKRWRLDVLGNLVPIIAVDTETTGLDTRIIVDMLDDGTLVYETKVDITGLCLASHADEGLYIPINHERGKCMRREDVAHILQPLFDVAHLLFYNAKFDREILKLTLGVTTRPFPYFEDVQVLQYDNDPKADMDDQKKGRTFMSDAGGLKALSMNLLGLEQIHLEELVKVKATMLDKDTCKCKHPVSDHVSVQDQQISSTCNTPGCGCSKIEYRESMRLQHCPFNWVPTDIAVWYAAPDALCTWGVWEKVIMPARSRNIIHKIDHKLVDSITWIERQRFLIDTERHAQTVRWHQSKLRDIEAKLREIAIHDGWPVKTDDDGNVIEVQQFNINSTPQIGKLLFDIRGMKKVKVTDKGNASLDADAQKDLMKLYPNDPFLLEYANLKRYVALHPDSLKFEPKDKSVRMYFRQNVVAGGRLAASGGEFVKDGGFELNPQGVKKPEGNWTVYGRILEPDSVPVDDIEEHEPTDLHKSCFRGDKKAKGIIKNHIANYLGYSICLVPTCTTCAGKFGILIEEGHLDANEVLNLRCLFIAPSGWTLFSVDYSNIEMRAAANCSGEPKFIDEFLVGEGDFHSLTASNVFSEFNDPNTPKEVRKGLRNLAKIINFALLYGGTEHTIFENMKKQDPNMTIERAREMVDAYWKGVPVFKAFVDRKQEEARNGPKPKNEPRWESDKLYHYGEIVQFDPATRYENGKDHAVYICITKGGSVGVEPKNGSGDWIKFMRCVTALGRVVSFVSAMEAQGIHFPLSEEKANYAQYRKYKGDAEAAKLDGDVETYKEFMALSQALWANPDTGVRNFIDWQKFFGKIQRIAVNTPLQGLAGDFMRMSLNKLCDFATVREPLIQSIFRLHATIHDEIDFIVKNEYVPYIIPRITRMMKLRRLHTAKNWPVPIECDIEYGRSWDVEHHVTGDKDHKPVAWTKIKGMENYIPDQFKSVMPKMLTALDSGEQGRIDNAKNWLMTKMDPRVTQAIDIALAAKDSAAREKALTIVFQLQEYWTIDQIPDEAEASLERFEAWEARMGMGPKNRDPKFPPFGYLGAIPLDAKVIRPELIRLDDPSGDLLIEITTEATPNTVVAVLASEPQQTLFKAPEEPAPAELRSLSAEDITRLSNALGKGTGTFNIPVIYTINGERKVRTIQGCSISEIPEEFLDKKECST